MTDQEGVKILGNEVVGVAFDALVQLRIYCNDDDDLPHLICTGNGAVYITYGGLANGLITETQPTSFFGGWGGLRF